MSLPIEICLFTLLHFLHAAHHLIAIQIRLAHQNNMAQQIASDLRSLISPPSSINTPRWQLPHTLCRSEQPHLSGLFTRRRVDEYATPGNRRDYMFEFLRWIRKETQSFNLEALAKECQKEVST